MSETKTFEELFLSSNMSHNLSVSYLKILLIADSNSNFMFIEKLKEWQIENNQYFDYSFFCGNFLGPNPNVDSSQHIPKAEADICGLLIYLENIQLKILYVPGSNDPKTLFQKESPTITVKSKNIHKKYIKLADDLYILGTSGLIPEINESISKESNIIQKSNQEEKEFFNEKDLQFSKDICYTIEQYKKEIKENNTTPNIQFILLSNIGPFYSPTSFYVDMNNKTINYSGSKSLQKIIDENKDEILINIHGGSKNNRGVIISGNTHIINPGGIDQGKFAILELERDPMNNYKWKIKSINLETL